ncbi:hypothetical protein [Pseudomonas anguilliseptica]|uniref:Chromate transporter n=1 Tax=Pseudomonas anguilliseptica TaxID=53406 RepID=A0A1H4Y3F0_PSEAG|nr:hypothetical protein [Pseudomonas anguilliseptica]SED11691.1 hypothetical protein SAMN05421553_2059 [Pseudomonas anguilliseptica]
MPNSMQGGAKTAARLHFAGSVDWPSALLAVAAALLRFKRGGMEVLLVSALAGLAVYLLR